MKVQTTASAVTYALWSAFAGIRRIFGQITRRDRVSLGMSAETLLTAYQPLGYCRTGHALLRRRSPQAKNLIPAIGTTKVGSGRWSTFPSECLFLLAGFPVAFRARFGVLNVQMDVHLIAFILSVETTIWTSAD
jgi:hypothetical protein